MSFAEYVGLAAMRSIEKAESRFRNRKCLQNTGFAGWGKCIKSGGLTGSGLWRGSNSPLFRHFRAGSRRSIAAAISAAARSSSSDGTGRGRAAGSRPPPRARSGERARREPDRRRPRAARRCPPPCWASSKAHTESAVLTCSVPSRAIRAGHAFRAIASPTAAGQRSQTLARARPAAAEPGELAADGVRQRVQGSPPRPGSARRGAPSACVVVITVCPSPATDAGEDAAAARVELGEHVVEQQQRRSRAGARASASRSASTASRCSPCEPNPRRSRPSEAIRGRRGAGRARSSRARGRRRGAPPAPPRSGGSAS